MPPGFKADAFRIHPDQDAVYHALEQSAKSGEKPQQGIWSRFQAARLMLDQDPQWGDVIPGNDIPDYFRQT